VVFALRPLKTTHHPPPLYGCQALHLVQSRLPFSFRHINNAAQNILLRQRMYGISANLKTLQPNQLNGQLPIKISC
jgi:hypothetical protein